MTPALERLRPAIEAALGVRIVDATPVSGGSIGDAFRVRLHGGDLMFVKTTTPVTPGLFASEAGGLDAMAATRTVRVPAVLGVAEHWIALEWLEPAPAGVGAWARLGEDLAGMHGHRSPNGSHGAERDNFIGSLPQSNGWMSDWPEFWRERRLRPQTERAWPLLDAGLRRSLAEVNARLPDLLAVAADDGPSLLHGDMWSGNAHATASVVALIDPSCAYGHREVDLAMAALFGGFPREFSAAYQAAWPLSPGAEVRRAVYQLYYLLVHVNLFGASYLAQTRRTAETALSA